MQVDESRRHQFASGVKDALCAFRRDIRFECLDHAEADADVAPRTQALTGVEYIAALDQQVESHCGIRELGARSSEDE
jgi:hypothetical protein